MTHLGTRISALADGQLGPLETERAFAHVAACPQCAAELRAARAARTALADAADVCPAPELTTRLLELGARSRQEPVPAPPVAAQPSPPVAVDGAPMLGRPPRKGWQMAAAGVFAAGLVAVGLVAVGEGPVVAPRTDAADALAALAGTAGAGSGAGESAVAVDGGLGWPAQSDWARPERLPAGMQVTSVSASASDELRIELSAGGGDVVIRETPGRLDEAAVGALAYWDLDGRRVYVVSTAPWHVVWQCGSSVVDVVANTDRETVRSLAGAFPAVGYDTGVSARLQRGWQATTRTLGVS